MRELYEADFHNPESMEAVERELTRGTCLAVRCLDVVAVAGLLWISWCVLGAAGFRVFSFVFFLERIRPAPSMRPPCFIYLSTSTGVSTALHYSISQSVCVCVSFVVFTDFESCTRPISTNPESMEAGEYGLTHAVRFAARTVSRWSRSPGRCRFSGAFGCGGICSCFP